MLNTRKVLRLFSFLFFFFLASIVNTIFQRRASLGFLSNVYLYPELQGKKRVGAQAEELLYIQIVPGSSKIIRGAPLDRCQLARFGWLNSDCGWEVL